QQKLPASYKTGVLPATYQQLYGSPLTSAENWNEVAASVYGYIELKHGINQMLASAMLMYTRYAKPFGNVMAPGSKPSTGQYIFSTSASVQDPRAYRPAGPEPPPHGRGGDVDGVQVPVVAAGVERGAVQG